MTTGIDLDDNDPNLWGVLLGHHFLTELFGLPLCLWRKIVFIRSINLAEYAAPSAIVSASLISLCSFLWADLFFSELPMAYFIILIKFTVGKSFPYMEYIIRDCISDTISTFLYFSALSSAVKYFKMDVILACILPFPSLDPPFPPVFPFRAIQ